VGVVAALVVAGAVWVSKSRKRESMVQELESEVTAST